ncbi:uncharacterized protein BJ171DRAFT_223713 [Polychytrium aggregatum]|uniref:uncharacterized protein n=1 Tax=Polychytrium aggregatum TaxID=110093 RepID=UPI0022FF2059|nr:uncharacterized protein BJ171DRAFT_223713 [Polychytrium aggregatum]KAI9197405.1 hypothetical protein BJ171DRAFT_223713 [Polychytrium aggregatum]
MLAPRLNVDGPSPNRTNLSLGSQKEIASGHHKASHRSSSKLSAQAQTIDFPKLTLYEWLVFKLDILIPEERPNSMMVPHDCHLQKVKYSRKKWRWRIVRNSDASLPEYLTDHRDDSEYDVISPETGSFLPVVDIQGKFIKKWDALGLLLLLFTASVTPFETAFLSQQPGQPFQFDILFLVDSIVDFIFFCDILIQMRTPYRHKQTGKIIRSEFGMFWNYFTGWFSIDLVSTLPWELLSLVNQSGGNLPVSQLRLLRFLRLTRLLKLLRVMRANRKLSQWKAQINLRYVTIQILQWCIIMTFIMHWIACGYRLAAERNDTSATSTDPLGWHELYAASQNTTVDAISIWLLYIMALSWSAGTVSLVGNSVPVMQPTNDREWGYSVFAFFISYLLAVWSIATISDVLSLSNRSQRTHDLHVDQYLEMFDRLKLEPRLKIKVYEYLSDHYASKHSTRYTELLQDLPPQLHGFITMEVFVSFIADIPFLEPFIDREPALAQDLCRSIEIRSVSANSHLFTEGYEGIYLLKSGIVAIEGRVYPSGSIFGRTCLREKIKSNECRALTNITVHLLKRDVLVSVLDKWPKIKYYAKRWTAWQVLRRYIYTYTRLYYMAARRGARMQPPLVSQRPNMREGELDDIDIAVLEHIEEFGF